MSRWMPIVSSFVVLAAAASDAEVLYVLVSPNEEEHGHFGYSVSGAGDINNDGYPDVIVGAYGEDPGTSPWEAGRAYVISHLLVCSCSLSGGELVLQWSVWPGARAYWAYGAANQAYFDPGLPSPYEHRQAVVYLPSTTWSSPNGIGNPDTNWTYLVIAVDDFERETCRSNPVGEHDFEGDIP